MNIYEKMVDIQGRLKAPKNQRNNFGKYNYRSCEDILEAVKPLLAEKKLILIISDQVIDSYINATATVTDGKETITVSAQAGIDTNRKGMDVAQSFGASSSYARKYALNGLFLIDDTKDPDATNTHGKAHQNASQRLPYLNKGTESYDNVKKALGNGYTISDVREKYIVTKDVEKSLLS